MTTIHATEKDFEKIIKESKKPIIIDFWAPWCGPCKMMGPVFEELSEELKEITFVKVNVDDNQNIASEYDIMGIPTLIVIKNGKEKNRISGFLPKQTLKSKIINMTS